MILSKYFLSEIPFFFPRISSVFNKISHAKTKWGKKKWRSSCHSRWKRRAFSVNNKSKEHLVLVRKGLSYLAVQNASWTSRAFLVSGLCSLFTGYICMCLLSVRASSCTLHKSQWTPVCRIYPFFLLISCTRKYKFIHILLSFFFL